MKKVNIVPPGEFPRDIWPTCLQRALKYVMNVSQAPDSLIIPLMLSVMGLACQDLVEVQVNERLKFQVTLYFIVIAGSGERKSFVFNLLISPVYDIQELLSRAYEEKLKKFNGEMKIWRLKESAADKAYREAVKEGHRTEHIEETIRMLQDSKPTAPSYSNLILNDVTTAAIKQQLGMGNMSFSIMNDEAGRLLTMDFLNETSVLNSLWSGGRIVQEKGIGPGININGARLGLTLMVQPKAFERFLTKNGEAVRDSGFLARCLIATCESTQGKRLQTSEPQQGEEDLKWFHERVTTLLEQGIERRKNSQPHTTIKLSKEALAHWNYMCMTFEGNIAAGEQLEAYRDYASKFHEQAVRLAAVIEVFVNGCDTEISLDSIKAGYKIANWYFDHFIQLMSSYDSVGVKSNAKLLDEWLYKHIYQKGLVSILKNEILQRGPNPLRTSKSRDEALRQLEFDGRVRNYKKEGKMMIEYTQAKQRNEFESSKNYSFSGGLHSEFKFVSYQESEDRKTKDPMFWK
ncbi:YfjI family protein [Aeromonas salmonicida]